MATAFIRQRGTAVSTGIALVRNILKRQEFPTGFSPTAFTTTQLYRIAVKEPVPKDFQPYPLAPPIQTTKSAKGKGKSGAPTPIGPVDVYPAHPEHPIRSIKFLKKYILSSLEAKRIIKLVRTQKSATKVAEELAAKTKKQQKHSKATHVEYLWKVVGPGDFPNPPKHKPAKHVVVGMEVGVGLDISHLNKRRQRARIAKIGRSVMQMKEYRQRTSLLMRANGMTKAAPLHTLPEDKPTPSATL